MPLTVSLLTSDRTMNELLKQFAAGDVRTLARCLTRVENRTADSFEFLRRVFPSSGRARVVGITGSPGSGKSTLVDKLASEYVSGAGPMTGIVAVDPSSPYSRGAILGDRIRMKASDAPGRVFIRSMATRGHLGGLAATTGDVVTVLDAWGIDPIFVETVGVGQDEVDIARVADVSVVLLVPGLGDDIQALKAGIMEIGDIFVINKCDHAGADRLEHAVRAALELAPEYQDWQPPVVRTISTTGEGISELRHEIDRCYEVLHQGRLASPRKRRATRDRLVRLLEERTVRFALDAFGEDAIEGAITAIVERKRDPYSVVDDILDAVGLTGS